MKKILLKIIQCAKECRALLFIALIIFGLVAILASLDKRTGMVGVGFCTTFASVALCLLCASFYAPSQEVTQSSSSKKKSPVTTLEVKEKPPTEDLSPTLRISIENVDAEREQDQKTAEAEKYMPENPMVFSNLMLPSEKKTELDRETETVVEGNKVGF